jgi:hypothetical protein
LETVAPAVTTPQADRVETGAQAALELYREPEASLKSQEAICQSSSYSRAAELQPAPLVAQAVQAAMVVLEGTVVTATHLAPQVVAGK